MNILPTEYLTPENPPTCPEDFIGPAREAARSLCRIVADSIKRGYLPIKMFYSGGPGVGKTALAYYLRHLVQASRFAITELNGVNLTIDVVRDIGSGLHLSHNDLFGSYRVIEIHEADRIPDVAQVGMLSLMDNLPRRTAVICTANSKVEDLEKRFQRRFKFTTIGSPTVDEIIGLLKHWDIPDAVANGFAVTCCGSPAIALQEAEEWLQTQPEEVAA